MKCHDSEVHFCVELETFCFMVYLSRESKFERKTVVNKLALTFQDII